MDLKKIIEEITLSKEETNQILSLANSICKKLTTGDHKAIIGGSFAKGTNLKGTYDVDIYVKFNYKKYKDKNISSILLRILKKKFLFVKKVHGSRDYYQIKRKN